MFDIIVRRQGDFAFTEHFTELLVGWFGFSGPLRQYFSLYRAVSEREGEREERIDESKNVQATPIRTYCKRSRPLPYSNPNQQDAPALEVYPAPSHQPTTPLRNCMGSKENTTFAIFTGQHCRRGLYLITIIQI